MHVIRTFFTAYPRQSVMTLAALLLAGVAEGFGLSMLLPLLGLTITATGGAAAAAPWKKPNSFSRSDAGPAPARTTNLGHFPLDRPVAAPDAIAAAADALLAAKRPLVIAGGGVHVSGAAEALAALQELAHLPVATTVMGKGAVAETMPAS